MGLIVRGERWAWKFSSPTQRHPDFNSRKHIMSSPFFVFADAAQQVMLKAFFVPRRGQHLIMRDSTPSCAMVTSSQEGAMRTNNMGGGGLKKGPIFLVDVETDSSKPYCCVPRPQLTTLETRLPRWRTITSTR